MNTSASKDKAKLTITSPTKDDTADNVVSRGHCTQDCSEKSAEAIDELRRTLYTTKTFDSRDLWKILKRVFWEN